MRTEQDSYGKLVRFGMLTKDGKAQAFETFDSLLAFLREREHINNNKTEGIT